jgi:hypothetical protein
MKRRPWDKQIGESDREHEFRKEAVLVAWREQHPKQPDPDDDALHAWLAEEERKDFTEEWRDAHPGRPLPDYAEIRRWAIEQHNRRVVAMARESGESFH